MNVGKLTIITNGNYPQVMAANKREPRNMRKRAADKNRGVGNSSNKDKDILQGRLQPDSAKENSLDNNTAREGKASQFTVSNVGNNGRIYLRYGFRA